MTIKASRALEKVGIYSKRDWEAVKLLKMEVSINWGANKKETRESD